jgi:hypothetical protein
MINSVQIRVNKQMDGFTFAILPSTRSFIKSMIPNSYPADRVFVAYNIREDFGKYLEKIENYIYPVLLGVENKEELKKLNSIEFIDTHTNTTLHKLEI